MNRATPTDRGQTKNEVFFKKKQKTRFLNRVSWSRGQDGNQRGQGVYAALAGMLTQVKGEAASTPPAPPAATTAPAPAPAPEEPLTVVVVRRGRPADLQSIVQLTCDLAEETENGLKLDPATVTRGVTVGLGEEGEGALQPRYWVATVGDAVVGFVGVSPEWSDWWATTYWWVISIFVAGTHRRQGVGAVMVQGLLAAADEGRVQTVNLRVEAENEGAQQFYRSVGFAVDGSHLVMSRGRKPDGGAVGS